MITCHSSSVHTSETPGPIFFNLHEEPSVDGGLKICTNSHGLLIKRAAMPIYGKKLLNIFFSRSKKALGLNLGI